MLKRMKVVPYAPTDREAVEFITRVAWAGYSIDQLLENRHGVLGSRDWTEHKTASVLAFCDAHPDLVVVAKVDGKTVGYATFGVDLENETGHVKNNAVDPDYQGRGIGSAMHRFILDTFREIGLRIARVSTLERDEPARHLYEKHGFRELARTIHYSMDLSEGTNEAR